MGGGPITIPGKKGMWGGNWGNLGQGLTEQQCQDACLEQPLCNFATFHQANGHCSAFDSCDKGPKIDKYKHGDKKGEVKSFVVWEKTEDKVEEEEEHAPSPAPEPEEKKEEKKEEMPEDEKDDEEEETEGEEKEGE